MDEMRTGTAAGVPYVALPPTGGTAQDAPLVVAWHLMDPPRSEAAMAAALPLAGLPAWRVYFGLPMFGARSLPGGVEEYFRLAAEDAVRNVYQPVFRQAVDEFPAAVAALREELGAGDGPVGLLGGSAGGAIVLLALAERPVPVAAAAAINPVSSLARLIALNEQFFGITYGWDEDSRAIAAGFEFSGRAAELAGPPLLLVDGADDAPQIREPLAELADALRPLQPAGGLERLTVPGLAHALAEEPGLEPAPQTPGAAAVDAAVTDFFRRTLV
jgi:pimeloyl-ACP methyl ester carboxylesterase